MDLAFDRFATVSCWSRSQSFRNALALIGCVLVLFGADFKGWVEQRLGSIAGALRVPLMALFCLIGSGAALIYATPWVERGLSQLTSLGASAVGSAGAGSGLWRIGGVDVPDCSRCTRHEAAIGGEAVALTS